MTVSIRRMSLGSGYEYLMRSVARGDGSASASTALTRYYAESGTPPGWYLGAGLAGLNHGLGVEPGSLVSEEGLFRLLGMLADPVTGEPLGRRPRRWPTPLAQRIQARVDALPDNVDRAVETARIGAEEHAAEQTQSRPVAGFDLTFSVPKSVSTVWALADPATQQQIHRAHRDAITVAIGYAEQHVFFSRSGVNGRVQEQVRGVVAAAFDHWDSRAGDPHLHSHVVIANRAQSADGTWRSLDSRMLFKHVVALSELHEGVLQDLLTDRLGWGWDERARRHSPVPRHDVTGVSDELIGEFSRRSDAIDTATSGLIGTFANRHGRQPNRVEMLRLRQQATLATRPDKHHHSLREQAAAWRERARPLIGDDPSGWAARLRDRTDLPALRAGQLDEAILRDAALLALDAVAERRATFSRANVLAEVHRQLHGVRFATPHDRITVADHTTALALASAVDLTPPVDHGPVPPELQRPDGTSKLEFYGAQIYTTSQILDAETRLLTAGRTLGAPGAPVDLDLDVSPVLGADQRAAVTAIATSGRQLDLLVGPAGSGKTAALAGLRAVWEAQYGPGSVTGLAPSAAAAQVLADELGIDTENTAKWLTEQDRQGDRAVQIHDLTGELASVSSRSTIVGRAISTRLSTVQGEHERWSLRPGQLIVIDEASLAGTLCLDQIVTQAQQAGAKTVLVGDWAQLSAIEAGGAFTMLTRDRPDVPELTHARRFAHDWERAASLQLRAGDHAAITAYTDHDRVHSGDRDAMLDALYAAWKNDTDAGLASLMIAGDRDSVDALNRRARTERITTGHVTAAGTAIANGAVAGIGDTIITRDNNRHLTTSGGSWVKNGDTWTVHKIRRDGALLIHRDGSTGTVLLPADYAREHVELGYATTAYRAQGRTLDTAHSLVNATTSREVLYVSATRGRQANTLYVDLASDFDDDTRHDDSDGVKTEHDLLAAVLDRTHNDTSAHAIIAERGHTPVVAGDPTAGASQPPTRIGQPLEAHPLLPTFWD